ncbi:hypothetical protein SKAU_G00341250 [Synaphobranchus kaupii]|uniref:Uncharacterized protein n=1 Tax=Synaphobranchus kaupii TaxID=118154 RepID=A0A9Q1IJJ7_SYNKA|nr:hypothetical protein SKAU_G00341250 [Synaphobranchus kaupii]
MAPIGMQVVGWAAARSLSPELILASLLCLIALIKFLAICSQCNRHAFDLGACHQMENSSSTLIRVVKLEDAAMPTENPCFEYITKDEQDNRSLQLSIKSGEVWYTPWRNHTKTSIHQGHTNPDILNHEVIPVDADSISPADTFNRIPTPSGVAVTPLQEEEEVITPPPAPPEISSHPEGQVRPLWKPETREDNGGIPESPTLHQQWMRAQHTYESLEDMGAATTEETETPAYETVADIIASMPHASDHMREAGSDQLEVPTADVGVEERMMGSGLTAMYAQVSKKYRDPAELSQSPLEGEEPVPLPHLTLEEEEEPAPPLPDRSFEM